MKPIAPIGAPAPRDDRAALERMSKQLEGVFLNQLFQAMRATVPHANEAGSSAEEMFTSMMDETLSAMAAERMQRGLGEALYRQLAQRLADDSPPTR